MTVLIEQSVCASCEGVRTCQKLKRLNPGNTIRDEMNTLYTGNCKPSDGKVYKKSNRPDDVLEIIITKCSMKDQYKMRKKYGLYTEL